MIKTSREGNALPPMILCKATVPILLGLGRSMGRYAQSNPPLLCRLYPRQEMPIVPAAEQPKQFDRQSTLSQFRSIIPRSMSGGLNPDCLLPNSPIKSPKTRASLNTYYSVPYDATTYFFAKYGSSFNQFPNMRFYETPQKRPEIQCSIQHLQTIFAIAKKLLTKETLAHLDEQAGDMYALRQIKVYGYKSFSETINLVLVTLLRELLQNQRGKTRDTYLIININKIHACFRSAYAVHQGRAGIRQAAVPYRPNRAAEQAARQRTRTARRAPKHGQQVQGERDGQCRMRRFARLGHCRRNR